jgi:hypothetical protein
VAVSYVVREARRSSGQRSLWFWSQQIVAL